jgi:hypothetical protein
VVEWNGLENRRGATHPGFESLPLRHLLFFLLERCQSGRMGSPAKGVNRYSVPRVRIPVFPPV